MSGNLNNLDVLRKETRIELQKGILMEADKALKLDNVSKGVPGQYIEASCEILGVIISTFYHSVVSHLPPGGKLLNC